MTLIYNRKVFMATSAPHLAINGTGIQRDKDWVKTSFMLPHVPSTPTVGMLTDDDRQWLYLQPPNTSLPILG